MPGHSEYYIHNCLDLTTVPTHMPVQLFITDKMEATVPTLNVTVPRIPRNFHYLLLATLSWDKIEKRYHSSLALSQLFSKELGPPSNLFRTLPAGVVQ
jgi:hypothetical protein